MQIPICIVNRFQLIIFCNSTFCSSFHNVFERSVDSPLYFVSLYHQGYLFINWNKSIRFISVELSLGYFWRVYDMFYNYQPVV